MQYSTWFNKTVNQTKPPSDLSLYFRVSILGLVLFASTYAYTSWAGIPGVLNKSVADTATILIGLSMILSGICYFWNFMDDKIIYRKHLGLIGFAFGVVHLLLSWSAFQRLLQASTWAESIPWAPLTGLIALIIFTIMALISNQYAAHQLGGKIWRGILRTGYIALALVFAHVVLLKGFRWVNWYREGMQTPPSMSLIVTVFIVLVILMRLMLWLALKKK